MKKLKKYNLFSLVFLCFSCFSLNKSSLNDEEDDNNIEKAPIYQNEDIEPTSFYKAMNYSSAKKLSNRIENDEDVLLFLHQKECSHCKKLEPTFLELLKEKPVEINYFADKTIEIDLNELFTYSPYLKEGFKNSIATPTLFLLNKNEAKQIDLTGTYSNLGNLKKALFKNVRLANIYVSSKVFSFSNEGLYLLYKENKPSLYYEYIKEKAEASNKNTYLYDVSKLSEEEMLNKFGLSLGEKEYALINKSQNTIETYFSNEEAIEAINSIY